MDAKDFAATYKARIELMHRNRPKEALIIASELKAQVQFRIQSTGTDFRRGVRGLFPGLCQDPKGKRKTNCAF